MIVLERRRVRVVVSPPSLASLGPSSNLALLMATTAEPIVLVTAGEVDRILARVAHEIAERNGASQQVVLLGIQRGGPFLAKRLGEHLVEIWKHPVPVGTLDVAMHRDDLDNRLPPEVHPTHMPCDINQKVVVLVDDVLYSGRTVRAAMDALNDFGRPRQVQLAVMIDRGHRELPIHPDFVGKVVPTAKAERIDVRLREEAGEDMVRLERL